MAEADVVDYSSEFTRAKRNVDGSQQQAASDGGSKVALKRVAVVVLIALLVATVIARFFTCYKNSQTMEKLQKLTDEYEHMKNVTGTEYSQAMEKLQKLTDKFEAMAKNLTDKRYLKCEEGWEQNGTQCYYFSTNKLTWSESRDECRRRGGDLVKVDSVEEQAFLQQKLGEKMIRNEDKHWIGLTDSKTEGRWLWTDGSPLNKRRTFQTDKMAEADAVVYSDVKFTKAKKNANALPSAVSSPTEATYSEVRISKTHPSTELPGSQQQAASDGGSKVTLKRVAVAVLIALLVATVIALGFTCYKNSQTMEKLQKLTDEYEAVKNVTDTKNNQTMEKFQKLSDEYERMKNVTGTEYSQAMEKLQKLTDKFEAMTKILTDKRYLKCEEGWEQHGTQCYYFSTNKLTWNKSRDECRRRGGDLVKVDSVEEQAFLQQKLREKMIWYEDKHWIGLTDLKTEGRWLWTDGSPLNESLKFWSRGQPDDWKGENSDDGEDCVRMGGSDLNTWFDKSCKVPHKSICEKCVYCGSA
ncbi:C-type lectin domain family 4 member F [Nibea albiflora]|uniref:C-type lectin domain family 4 member F n=1 Tax=Nibea albiflora TaxID=240163 RepID=A0ACB7ESW0_NIBAL|nr:C-type lectin domain family 4 member F [Nibea albiflora]